MSSNERLAAERVRGIWKVHPEAKVLHTPEKCEEWQLTEPAHKRCVYATVHWRPEQFDGTGAAE